MKNLVFVLVLVFNLLANDDLKLIKLSYKNGLKPVPSNFETLLRVLNTNSKELSKEKIILGKKLFFEKDLSLAKDISCATCHSFDKGGADAIPTAIGHKDRANPFHLNTPTVLNTAFSKNLFWNGSSTTLQDQAKGPLQAPFEMSITPKLAQKRIAEKKEYKQMFIDAYGNDEITFEKITDAIASYEKTIITRGRYDEFLLGKTDALSKKEKEGLELFITKSCVGCHNGIALGGQTLRKFPLTYHNIWSMIEPQEVKTLQKKYTKFLEKLNKLDFKDDMTRLNYLKSTIDTKDIKLLKEGFFSQVDNSLKVITTDGCTKCHENNSNLVKKDVLAKVAFPFKNKGGFLGAKPNKYFRVPLLRNIVQTKPYFHNGSIDKLEDAIKIMGEHQSRARLKDEEIEKIVAFLEAVDGKLIDYTK